jgi:hypothetical protein
MSKLQLFSRPFVVFDPGNKEHRSHYYEFVHSGTWGRCPVRFMVQDDQGDLVTMIQRSLIAYYVNKEFSEPFRFNRNGLKDKLNRQKTASAL